MAASQLDNRRETQQKREAAHLAFTAFRADRGATLGHWRDPEKITVWHAEAGFVLVRYTCALCDCDRGATV